MHWARKKEIYTPKKKLPRCRSESSNDSNEQQNKVGILSNFLSSRRKLQFVELLFQCKRTNELLHAHLGFYPQMGRLVVGSKTQ